jgi:cytochrome c-type biogenesis protein CcsB
MPISLLFILTTGLYLLAIVFYLRPLLGKHVRFSTFGRFALLVGVVLQAIYFGLRHATLTGTPVTSLQESLAFFAWCLVFLYLLVDLRFRLPIMGAFAASFASLLMLGSALSPAVEVPLNPVLRSWLFPVHISFAFLGSAAFSLSFGAGVMYLLQDRMLKSKRFTGLYQMLPSLDRLDKVNYTCLSIGFPLMTLGIISGALWGYLSWGSYWRWDPKETWAMVTWLMYAGLLHGRFTAGWRGRNAAFFSIIAFLFLLFTFLGVSLFMGGYHTFEAFTAVSAVLL